MKKDSNRELKNYVSYILLIVSIFVFIEVSEISSLNLSYNSPVEKYEYLTQDFTPIYLNNIQEKYSGIPIDKILKFDTSTFIGFNDFKLEKIIELKREISNFYNNSLDFELPITDDHWVSSIYGMRYHPIFKKWRFHNGIDLAAVRNTSIRAAMSGKVIFAGYYPGYGVTVILKHGNGFTTRYAHCRRLYTKVGKIVQKGDKISSVGNTGTSLGYHLHFEIRKNNIAINPETLIDFRRILAKK